MRRIVFIVSFLSIVFTGIAQNWTAIKFEKEDHDFGNIKEEDGLVGISFNFTNMGKNSFVISEIVKTCGCTTSDYTKTPVKKGKSGYVKVIIDPSQLKGFFQKSVIVKGNIHQDIRLTVSGTVVPRKKSFLDQYAAPYGNLRAKRAHIIVGELYHDEVDSITYTFYNQSNVPIRINKLGAPKHILSKSFPLVIPPQNFGDIKFQYSAPLKNDIGYVFDEITFYTDDPKMPEKKMRVVANIIENLDNMTEEQLANSARIKINKQVINFGTVEEGKIIQRELFMKNEGKSTLNIYDIETDCGCTATTLGKRKLFPGDVVRFKVVFHTKDRHGWQEKLIKITSNDPTNRELVLTIKGNINPKK